MPNYQKYLERLNETDDESFEATLNTIKEEIEADYQQQIAVGNSHAICFLKKQQSLLFEDYDTFKKREEHFEDYINARFDILEKYLTNLGRKIQNQNN